VQLCKATMKTIAALVALPQSGQVCVVPGKRITRLWHHARDYHQKNSRWRSYFDWAGITPRGDVSATPFDAWFRDTFLPALGTSRATFGYDGPAVLLLDNCPAHGGPEPSVRACFLPLRKRPNKAHLPRRLLFSRRGRSNQSREDIRNVRPPAC
jgi:hypothetical protein